MNVAPDQLLNEDASQKLLMLLLALKMILWKASAKAQ